ncbi:E3 ubiquitin-protein ligase p28-like [Acrasis kona]|uniref:E3 ubiquitin-protein ligase p28-like n=1 Tax=Acrasis kona TaxID=1008807 RepID=A0AAW2ZLH2_9EUKA
MRTRSQSSQIEQDTNTSDTAREPLVGSKRSISELDTRPRKTRRLQSDAIVDLTQEPDEEPNTDEEKKECAICFEEIKELGMMDCCNHDFCFACVNKWSNECNTCPVCKRRFKTITKKRLDNGKTFTPLQIEDRDIKTPQTHFIITRFFEDDDDEDDEEDDEFDPYDEERASAFNPRAMSRFLTNYFYTYMLGQSVNAPAPPPPSIQFVNTNDDPIVISDSED